MATDANGLKAPAAKRDTKQTRRGTTRPSPLPLADVEKKPGSSPDGLSQAYAAKCLPHYGADEIVAEKTNPSLKFLACLTSERVERVHELAEGLGRKGVHAVHGWEKTGGGNLDGQRPSGPVAKSSTSSKGTS